MLSPSLSDRLSLHARHALKEARDIARYTKSTSIELRHLILALALEDGSLGGILLEHVGFKKDTLGKYCLKKTTPGSFRRPGRSKAAAPDDIPLAPETQTVIKRAFFLASEHHYPYVGTEHLISALLESNDPFLTTLRDTLKIESDKVDHIIESHLHFEEFPQMARMFEASELGTSNADSSSESTTPFLDQFTINVAEAAPSGSVVGRTAELERLMQILGRKEKRNALLIGDPGVGKTALVSALAQKIARGEAGPLLRGKEVRTLDLALLVAGTSFRGEFETRLKELLKEVVRVGNIILFIDEIHTIVGTGNLQGGLDAANILKPSLARGEIQCIGATTLTEYKRHIEKDAALERRFQTVLLREPTPEEALHILESVRGEYEAHHRVQFPKSVLEHAVQLSVRFIHDRYLPDKALDLIDEAAALVRRASDRTTLPALPQLHILESKYAALRAEKSTLIEKAAYDQAERIEHRLKRLKQAIVNKNHALDTAATESALPTVTSNDLLLVLSRMIHVPVERLAHTSPAERLASLSQALKKRFVGQTAVRSAILELLTRSAANLSDERRPIGSLLLLGPTGVGKTHLAKVLAEAYFGDTQALIRFDMSEFMERHSAAQMLGAPAGYIGYGEGGKLTEAIRRRPSSVVLFDEIEKAHPDVINLLLQILDEGSLTDAEGRRVSFRHALIILTSNIGTASFTQAARIGFSEAGRHSKTNASFETTKAAVFEELRTTLRPELLSRLDHTLVFEPLDEAALTQIAIIELETLKAKLRESGTSLNIAKTVPHAIAKEALREGEGARLIRKHIREHIENKIAERLVKATTRPKRLTLSFRHATFFVR